MGDRGKYVERFKPVLGNTLFLSVSGVSNLLLSLLVIRIYNADWWGRIVELQIIYYLVTNFTSWGNKEYLLREFSKSPARINALWNASFAVRSLVILVPSCVLLVLFDPSPAFAHLAAWIALRHIQQSFETVATYNKQFNAVILSELAALFVLVSGLYAFRGLTFDSLLMLITCSYFLRTFLSAIAYRKLFSASFFHRPDLSLLAASFTFMLLAFSNVVQTKADAMVVNVLMSKEDLAQYGVITGFLFLVKSAITFIIYPFVKNIYRLGIHSTRIMTIQFLKYGFVIAIAGIAVQYLGQCYVYHFDLPWVCYLLGFVFVLPAFWYTPVIFYLFKHDRQLQVIIVTCAGIIVNVAACFLWVEKGGLTGALCAMGISQLAMLACYYIAFLNIRKQELIHAYRTTT